MSNTDDAITYCVQLLSTNSDTMPINFLSVVIFIGCNVTHDGILSSSSHIHIKNLYLLAKSRQISTIQEKNIVSPRSTCIVSPLVTCPGIFVHNIDDWTWRRTVLWIGPLTMYPVLFYHSILCLLTF